MKSKKKMCQQIIEVLKQAPESLDKGKNGGPSLSPPFSSHSPRTVRTSLYDLSRYTGAVRKAGLFANKEYDIKGFARSWIFSFEIAPRTQGGFK